jgi:hypothetical protein
MTRALEVRLRTYQGQAFTESALLERVTAMPGRVEHVGDDWWSVGFIVDTIADVEIEVRCRPPRVAMSERLRPTSDPGSPSFIAEDAQPMGPPRYWRKSSAI